MNQARGITIGHGSVNLERAADGLIMCSVDEALKRSRPGS
jgi:hypothetical protein